MKDMHLGRRIIAILLVITALTHINSAYKWLGVAYNLGEFNGFATFLLLLGVIFEMLNFIAAYGLFTLRSWGYSAAYAAIVYSSLVFKAGYIPFFNRLFPAGYIDYANLLANIAILTLLISMHIAQFEPKPRKQKKKSRSRK